jgi:hypothetical protein
MNKKSILLLFNLLLIIVKPSAGQKQDTIKDTVQMDKAAFISVLNLRPVQLKKNGMLLSFQTEFPEFYKTFNPKTRNNEKVPGTIAINEAYYYGHVVYGFSDRVNLFALLPVASVNHYSPNGTTSGKGFGDIKLGGSYSLIDLKDNLNSLTSSLAIGLPTGKYKNLLPYEYPLGLGAFRFKGDLTGLHRFKRLDMVYSVYYEYRTNNSNGLNVGDETGAYLTLQKQLNTEYGNFGLEGGIYAYWNFKDRKNGSVLLHTNDYAGNLYIGGWYNYLKNFYIRFGVPYTVYQNNSWLTKYEVLLQLDYQFKLNKKN